ncbi:BTB/POZ and MATH domain-containing protein 2-like isoform X2 [Carex rostrata]
MANDDQSEAGLVCRMETFTKSFPLKIIGYSLIKRIQPENDMVVGTFELGGHKWAITFLPGGNWMTVYVSLLTETKTTMGLEVEYSLFNHKSGEFSDTDMNPAKSEGKVSKQGSCIKTCDFMQSRNFERSDYLKDDCLMLKCSVKLIKPLWVDAKKKQVIVPSSDFLQNFYQLWDSREGADVVFQVGEETISAHRTVLAARSLVFKAEFFGPMLESKTECVKIKDIKPEVFKLMLQFVYTDSIPLNEEVSYEVAQHLLVAADRYGLERLKLICEEKLSDSIDVEKATDILVFSDNHNCDKLKDICLDFVASGENLKAVMATDGFKHFLETSPFILRELLERVDCRRKSN